MISVAESMSKSTEQYWESFSSDSQMNEISEKTWNEELNKLFLVKIVLD